MNPFFLFLLVLTGTLFGDNPQLMIDFTGKKLHWVDKSTGELVEVDVFVGTLPCPWIHFCTSKYKLTPNQEKEHFICCVINFLNYIGETNTQLSLKYKGARF